MKDVPKSIFFDGYDYHLVSNGRYYLRYSTKNDERKGAKGLHVAIWELNNGKEVPKGYHIHHIDGNTMNNDISNLELVEAKKHLSEQAKKNFSNYEYREKNKKHLAEARKLASAWHASEDGKKWHSKHAKKIWDNKEKILLECKECKNEYESYKINSKFCSDKCGERFRYRENRITYTKSCEYCNNEFTKDRSRKNKESRFCSVACVNFYRHNVFNNMKE